jgi:VanZ family protein
VATIFRRTNSITIRLSRVSLAAIFLVTAVPAGLRDPRTVYWELLFNFRDALGNVFLYLPWGFFLQASAKLRGVAGVAALTSGTIEIAQLFFVRRQTQPVDALCNTAGAVLGALIGRSFKVRSDRIAMRPLMGFAFVTAAAIWTAAYLLLHALLPAYAGRGTVAVVAFLSAAGLTAIVQPQRSRTSFALAAGAGLMGVVPLTARPLLDTPLGLLGLAIAAGVALWACCTREPRTCNQQKLPVVDSLGKDGRS